jgi:hypothetical protein
VSDDPAPPFEELDFLYTPSRDVAAEMAFMSKVLGARIVFAIEGMGTRVAALQFTEGAPLVLLADHVEGERPVLVYRVEDLGSARGSLEARGCEIESTLEIPHGPILTIRAQGGHRFGIYELTRPEVAAHFEGRRDF